MSKIKVKYRPAGSIDNSIQLGLNTRRPTNVTQGSGGGCQLTVTWVRDPLTGDTVFTVLQDGIPVPNAVVSLS